MKQKTSGVSLREVLRQAFASLSASEANCSATRPVTPIVAPLARTAGDRSRMRQKVLEELALRRGKTQADAHLANFVRASSPKSLEQSSATLFGTADDLAPQRTKSRFTRGRFFAPIIVSHCRTDVRDLVAKAYTSLSRRVPEDHVLVDPEVNEEFISRCKLLGADVPEVLLNRTLLNNRKAKRHAEMLREPARRLPIETFDRIRHAVEIAASLVQRKWFILGNAVPSVDDMLCNPEQRRALHVYISSLHDRVDPIDCHLTLLAFRKSGREGSARSADLSLPERCLFAPLKSLDPDDVAEGGGIYRILCLRRPVFVGSTAALRTRLHEHLERGGEAFLPKDIPFHIEGPLSVEVFNLPKDSPRCNYNAIARRLRQEGTEDHALTLPDLNLQEFGTVFNANEGVVRLGGMVG